MNIIYLCQYFVPEPGAPSARLYELSRAWVQGGHNVKIITGMPNHPTGVVHPDYRGRLAVRENLDGITVLRNWIYATPNEGIFKKIISHLSFMVSAVLLGLPRLGPADVIIVSSPNFLSAFSAYVISRVRHIPFVFEVRDLWPAAFVDLGVLTNPLLIQFLEFCEMFLYRRAALVATVTTSFRLNLIQRGLAPEKVVTVTNGADLDFFVPGPRDNDLAEELGLLGKFVVSYIGAHGISHGLETVLMAADRLRGVHEIVFLMVGDGAQRSALLALKSKLCLRNVQMFPSQSRSRVREFYQASDVCLVPLVDVPLFDAFVPSKIFEIMACGVPIIGAVRGEAREIMVRSGAARLVEPEDDDAIAQSIEWIRAHPNHQAQMGKSGRSFVSANFNRIKLAKLYERILMEVVSR